MQTKKTKLKGSYFFDLQRFTDKRGFFCELMQQKKYKKYIKKKVVQTNFSFSKKKYT